MIRAATDPSATVVSPARLAALRRDVLGAAPAVWRELPWRRTRDPWAVLVSEVMLQQTQAARVVEPWRRFMARFPTPADCAAGGTAEVVRAWAGLGYNRRAVRLHRAAAVVTERYGGEVPGDLDALTGLPGVGGYTARAVLAFAFGDDVGVVDTNVARVLARAVAGRTLGARQAQAVADRMVPAGEGWRFNQAMLDIGAAWCTSGEPECGPCALRRRCKWARAGGSGGEVLDPALGSAGVSRRQPAFAGSDRQGRGRLVGALRLGPVRSGEAAAVAGWPGDEERARRVVQALVAEELAAWQGDVLTLA